MVLVFKVPRYTRYASGELLINLSLIVFHQHNGIWKLSRTQQIKTYRKFQFAQSIKSGCITNKSQEVSPFPSGNQRTRQQWTDAKAWQTQDINNTNDPQKKYRLVGMVSKNILLEGLNRFHSPATSPLVQMWIKTHRCLVCMKDP